MKYKEFKEKIKKWGEKYGYKLVINIYSEFIDIVFEGNGYPDGICEIHKTKSSVVDLNWEAYKNLPENARDDLFKIVTEFGATKPEDREYVKTFDSIIESLTAIQFSTEKIAGEGYGLGLSMQSTEEILNLMNDLEDTIIDLEEYKNSLNKRPTKEE